MGSNKFGCLYIIPFHAKNGGAQWQRSTRSQKAVITYISSSSKSSGLHHVTSERQNLTCKREVCRALIAQYSSFEVATSHLTIPD